MAQYRLPQRPTQFNPADPLARRVGTAGRDPATKRLLLGETNHLGGPMGSSTGTGAPMSKNTMTPADKWREMFPPRPTASVAAAAAAAPAASAATSAMDAAKKAFGSTGSTPSPVTTAVTTPLPAAGARPPQPVTPQPGPVARPAPSALSPLTAAITAPPAASGGAAPSALASTFRSGFPRPNLPGAVVLGGDPADAARLAMDAGVGRNSGGRVISSEPAAVSGADDPAVIAARANPFAKYQTKYGSIATSGNFPRVPVPSATPQIASGPTPMAPAMPNALPAAGAPPKAPEGPEVPPVQMGGPAAFRRLLKPPAVAASSPSAQPPAPLPTTPKLADLPQPPQPEDLMGGPAKRGKRLQDLVSY
jgi:hypothetical protein